MSILRAGVRFFSSTAVFNSALKPPQPPKLIDDSTSALDYKRSQRVRPPPLPPTDLPRSRTAEEAVTNILYNTPPASLQPFKKYSPWFFPVLPTNPLSADIFSTVLYKTNLVYSLACRGFSQEEVSTSILWLCVAPRYATWVVCALFLVDRTVS